MIQGYVNGNLVGLISCAIAPTIGSTTLVETINVAGSSFFLL
jgi:hypothetical protein